MYNMSEVIVMANNKMKSLRVMKNMSQQDLADAIGVTRQTISLIETDQYNPSLQICIAICKALDSDLNTIFWKEDENESK